ncbi:hypothetical protein PSCSP2_00004 [Prochlorococcus phage P-SCSP2]|nr:hypothetical protein PSCSP2_00004 [Prochlorococcus phage P-SCSP2]|tara:strand:+ start:70 stop:294 length:225 start_codon:yes stop_codon:yes gene_type:complete
MKCSKCGSLESTVNNSIKRNGTGTNQKSTTPFVWRSRTCSVCGNKFSTREYTTQGLIDFGKKGYLEMIDDLMTD